uniref:Serine-threonine/tyrosine-protein kinase catalytic domain-containing protein n=1 Tax=Panagrolaimus superbus TaxID=310955 RepID=A0A914Z1S0_9BILA
MIKHGPMPDLPERTPNPMKDLIHQCWTEIPSERPEFRDIVKGICKMVHDNPQMKFPKPAEFSVNKISGVYREETGSISTEEALGEKSVIFVSDLNTPQMLTSEESKETASRESKGSRDSAEDVTRGIRMTKKSAKSANERRLKLLYFLLNL